MAIWTLGLNAKLYRNTGSYGSPTWDEVAQIKNLSCDLAAVEVDVTTRGSGGWRAIAVGLKDAPVSFEILYDNTNTDYEAFRDAYINATVIECAVMDGAITTAGNEGLRASFSVTKFARKEDLEGALMIEVEMKPGPAANNPAWYTVPA